MQYPSCVSPDNTPIDVNDKLELKFKFFGNRLIGAIINIYDCVTGKPIGYVENSDGSYTYHYTYRELDNKTVFNGEFLNFTIINILQYMQNGKDYEFCIKLCQDKFDIKFLTGRLQKESDETNKLYVSKKLGIQAPFKPPSANYEFYAFYIRIEYESYKVIAVDDTTDDECTILTVDGNFSCALGKGTQYTALTNFLDSKHYFLPCRSTAEVSTAVSFDKSKLQCTATYFQQEDVKIKKYKWELLKSEGNSWNVVDESSYIYSIALDYTFYDFFENACTYKARLRIFNQFNSEIISESEEFTYTTSDIVAVENAEAFADYNSQCLKIKINTKSEIEWVEYTLYRQTDEGNVRLISRCNGYGNFNDFLVASNHKYKYYIVPVLKDGTVCQTYITDDITVRFDSWSLTSIAYQQEFFNHALYKTVKTVLLSVNTKSDNFVINKGITQNSTIDNSVIINSNSDKYISVGLSAIIGQSDEMSFFDTIQNNDDFIKFITSDNNFILKSPKGHIYIVKVSENPQFNFDENVTTYPVTVNLKFTESMNIDDIIVNCEYLW